MHGGLAGKRAFYTVMPKHKRRRARFRFAAIAAMLCLGGCISMPQSDALRAAPPQDLPARVELTGVPFHQQYDFLCGPAALAMVFNAAGVPADVESVTPLVYLPGREGSLQAEMLEDRRLRWRVLLIQAQKNVAEFRGSLEISFVGSLNGKPWVTGLPNGSQVVKFAQFGRFQGMLDVPAQAVIKSVSVKVLEGSLVKAAQSANL